MRLCQMRVTWYVPCLFVLAYSCLLDDGSDVISPAAMGGVWTDGETGELMSRLYRSARIGWRMRWAAFWVW